MKIRSGLDAVCADQADRLRGRRLGLLCHAASVNGDLVHAVDALMAAGVKPVRLFGPEHGVRGEAQDMIGVGEQVDRLTGIPVVSLYGDSFASLTPPPGSLDDLEVLVVDLQDIGSRYYTYVWTMTLAMQAAAKAGIEIAVLDRPNPLGGSLWEGGAIDPGFESFVGLGSLPVRHGLTIGEIAKMACVGIPGRFLCKPLDVALTVVPMEGWRRDMLFDETGLPWVMPSPNMPTLDTGIVYPGMCLIEGTNISEGRGTTRPFEIVGAPWVNGQALADALTREKLPGVRFRPMGFEPTFQKHGRKSCGGVQLHVDNRPAFLSYHTGVAVVRALYQQGGGFGWRTEQYEFVSDRPAIDLLTGNERIRKGIESGATMAELAATWSGSQAEFAQTRAPHLLYR